IAYGKPLGTFWSAIDNIDEDVRFLAETLKLPAQRLCPTLAALDADSIARRISGDDAIDYAARLRDSLQPPAGDLVLLEAAGTLEEGRLFDLSLLQMAAAIDAAVVLVARCPSLQVADSLLWAKQCLGDRLVGVLLNDIPADQQEKVANQLQPFLEQQGIPVLALLPRNHLLRSVSVGELVNQLQAEVLCRPDRLDLMVESLTIGAMNVNSALKYFRKAHNMAVVTGGDRADLQLAALETSTQCLILTGHIPPMATILARAEDLEIPILSVDLDTLTTVEIVDRAFGQVRLHEPIKVQCVYQMMEKYLDVDRLMQQLGLEPAVRA
ncbi:MAG: phosphotransacetylase family protein, partial [Leptolyngbyaceae cyanobacterium SM1_3_5]|nr:phosphotransacetylase family protein [Leptolyngbyaceae cyanobacterium SM1_3_5]